MTLTRLALSNPVAAVVAVLLVLLFGTIALVELPVQMIPSVVIPRITIETPWRAATPEDFGDRESQLIETRVDVHAGSWIVGESVRLDVPTAKPKQALAVPRDALILRSEGAFVYRVGVDQTAERVPVTTGAGDGFIYFPSTLLLRPEADKHTYTGCVEAEYIFVVLVQGIHDAAEKFEPRCHLITGRNCD